MFNFHYLSLPYFLIFSASFLCWFIFEQWVFSRDRKTKLSDAHSLDRSSIKWVIAMLIVGIVLGFNFPNIVPQFNFQNHFIIFFCLGIALIWTGIFFRYWAIRTLGKFFRTRVIIQEKHQLVTSGPYKYLRNPAYTGALITLVGFGFGAGNWISVIFLLIIGLAAYAWRIAVEDKALRERFGEEYEDYKKRTWALIPFIW